MKDLFYIFVVSCMMLLFTYQTICQKGERKELTRQIQERDLIIDSLVLEIDTLSQKIDIFNFQFLQKEWNNLNGIALEIAPIKNLLILFPSYLNHSVLPYYGTTVRKSLAFNIVPVGSYGHGDSAT